MPVLTFVLTERMLAAGTLLPVEMWRAAESTAVARDGAGAALTLRMVSVDGAPVETQAGVILAAACRADAVDRTDVIYLPALWRNPRPVLAANRTLSPWLAARHAEGAMIAGVGTGCCLMAEAGLLDGRAATTHWHYFNQFARAYPKVELKRDYFITQSGNLYCAASVNALADVTVHLIARFYGHAVASHVERNFSHEIRKPYQQYRYLDGEALQHADELVIDAQLWLQRHLTEPLRVSDIAARLGVSVRTLGRRFRIATGRSPLDYLQELRIDAAKELLESTNLGLAEVAARVGIQDRGHFARLFERYMAVSPRAYRQTVRAKLFSAESRSAVST